METAKPRHDSETGTLRPADRIDQFLSDLNDWRGDTLSRIRTLILTTDATISEEWKWNTPVWSHRGILCTGEVYKSTVKLTFANGAALADPTGLFNSSLTGKVRRAIDIHENDSIDPIAFQALVKAAISRNDSSGAKVKSPVKSVRPTEGSSTVRLLSGGNPQIAKADGDAPVQAYIQALPDWKREMGARLDALIVKTIPHVRKAVKWNSPLYGIEGQGWFLGIHAFNKYLKLAFFFGASLDPVPPVASKDPNTRYLHVLEDGFDAVQLASWIRQAAAIPGWVP